MKISKKFRRPVWSGVGEFIKGVVVEMQAPVNQYCKKDDLYIICDIPPCYLRDAKGPGYTTWILKDKVPVTNLRTGGISMVQEERPCRAITSARVVT